MSWVDIKPLYSPNPNNRRNFMVIYHDQHIITTVTATPSVVRTWLFKIRRYHFRRIQEGTMVVGLGLQWTPTCNPSGCWNPRSTLQLCVGRRCLIFHIAYAQRVPIALWRFLHNPKITFVTVSDILKNETLPLPLTSQMRLTVTKLVNLCDIVAKNNFSQSPLRVVTGGENPMDKMRCLIVSMEGVNMYPLLKESDWEDNWLDEVRVGYACLNASVAFFIGIRVKVWTWANHEGIIYDL